MPFETPGIERIVQEIKTLSPEDRIRLIGHIVETILPPSSARPNRPLVYGEFHGPRLSCEEDFKEAEWRPGDEDTNGR